MVFVNYSRQNEVKVVQISNHIELNIKLYRKIINKKFELLLIAIQNSLHLQTAVA